MTQSSEGMPSYSEALVWRGRKDAERDHTRRLVEQSEQTAAKGRVWCSQQFPDAVDPAGRVCLILVSGAVLFRLTTTSADVLRDRVEAWALEGHGCTANVQTCPNCNQANTTREAA